MVKRTNTYIFVSAALLIAFLHVSKSYTGLSKYVLNILFVWGFLGLLLINILLFTNSLFAGIRSLKDNKEESSEKKNKRSEKILAPILQGEKVLPQKLPTWASIGISICIGLIAGSALGWFINRIIELKYNGPIGQ